MQSSKRPSELYYKLVKLIRFCSFLIGGDVLDKNYKPNLMTAAVASAIGWYYLCSIYTIAKDINTDWTILLDVFSPISCTTQGLVKMCSFLIYPKLYHQLAYEIAAIYEKYEMMGVKYENQLLAWNKSMKHIMIIGGLIYFCSAISALVTPPLLYIFKGEKHLIIMCQMPYVDASTNEGYFITIVFNILCVFIAAFGLYACDLYVILFLTHSIFFYDIFKLKVNELHEMLEMSNNEDKRVTTILNDIAQWHQYYLEFNDNCNILFFWTISAHIICTTLGILSTLLIIMLKYWPNAYPYIFVSFVWLYMYSFLGTRVETCNDQFCDGIYDISWYDLNLCDQKTVSLMLLQSQVPRIITIAGVEPLSMNTAIKLQRLLFFTLLYGLAIAQDYQDYQENTPRPAPIRLRPSGGLAQDAPRPTPVAILKQINKHNEDGSYTYGYEGGDGSFKIETKLATGEVKGKYGYVDETGKVRVVEYGANKFGFQPSGEGITVAPPTLVDESIKEEPDYEDEPVRPQKAYRPPRPQQQQISRPQPAPAPRPQPQPQPRPQYFQYEQEPEPEPPRRIQYAPPPQASAPPAPPRLQIPGAQRSTDVLYSPVQRPARPEPDYSQSQNFGDGPSNVRVSRPVYAPPPSQPAPSSARANNFLGPPAGGRPLLDSIQFGPPAQTRPIQEAAQEPLPRYQPQISHQPQLQGRSGGGSSLLDQLARDYALPQSNSQPLHDISFGYY